MVLASFKSTSMAVSKVDAPEYTVCPYSISSMLVRALRLRHRGLKLSAEELKAATPLSGRLQMQDSHYNGRDGRGKQVCLLLPLSGRAEPLVELFSARVLRIESRGVLIGGEEDFWNRKVCSTYRQVLWAWPSPPDMPEPPPATGVSSPEVRKLLEALDAMA